MRADVELDIGRRPFASGLLPELIAVLRRRRPADLVAVVGDEAGARPALETWLPIHRRSTSRDYGRKGWLAVGLPLRSGSRVCRGTGRGQSTGGLTVVALHEFPLSPALRLLLRAFVARRDGNSGSQAKADRW